MKPTLLRLSPQGRPVSWTRHSATPDVARELNLIWYETDIRAVLPTVKVPTLLLAQETHPSDVEEAEYIASLMPMAEFKPVPGGDLTSPDLLSTGLNEIRRFVGVEPPKPDLDTVLATVHDQQVSFGPFGLPRTRKSSGDVPTPGESGDTSPDRAIVDKSTPLPTTPDVIPPPPSGDEPWGPVWPDNVHETGVSPAGQSGCPIMAAEGSKSNSEKGLVTAPIRGFCALHAFRSPTTRSATARAECPRGCQHPPALHGGPHGCVAQDPGEALSLTDIGPAK